MRTFLLPGALGGRRSKGFYVTTRGEEPPAEQAAHPACLPACLPAGVPATRAAEVGFNLLSFVVIDQLSTVRKRVADGQAGTTHGKRSADRYFSFSILNEVNYVAKTEAEGAKSLLDSAENQRKSLLEAREVLQQRHRQALEDLEAAKNDPSELRKGLAGQAAEVERLAARVAEKEAHLVTSVNARAADGASYEERLDALRANNSALEDAVRNECDDIALAPLVSTLAPLRSWRRWRR